MPLTPSQVRALKRKAADNSLEVEHLLRVAAVGDATYAPLLRQLKADHGWSDTGWEGTTRVVPFGRWVDVVCRFLEDGYPGLVRMAGERPECREFCVGVLEELPTVESVSALLVLTDQAPDVRLAGAFNRLLSFQTAPEIDDPTAARVRGFLHRLLRADLSEPDRATVVCSLRGVGDAESLELIAGLPPFGGSWDGLEASAARAIRKRLR